MLNLLSWRFTGIPVELCISSNVLTESVTAYDVHHFKDLHAAGMQLPDAPSDVCLSVKEFETKYTGSLCHAICQRHPSQNPQLKLLGLRLPGWLILTLADARALTCVISQSSRQ